MRIATPDDAQAIVDYWNTNLAAIEIEVGKTLKPMEVSWLTTFFNFFNDGFIVWDSDNVMVCCSAKETKLNVEFCWSSGVSNLKAGLVYCAQQAKIENFDLITGIVRTEGSFAQFLNLYNIPGINQGEYSTYADTPDNFILKLS